ncbi:MAG: 4-(cytidine 5'-diphospho)-2-C-methyl-D-erythritol kinase [Rikenellaceae bacterium]
MILRANCKINIGLDVLRRRADGYHDLDTVMIPLHDLYDEVGVEPLIGSQDVRFEGVGMKIDCAPEQNLCVRAARLVQSRYSTDGVAIRLEKRVPFGAGLGGGSADATAVIVAMNELFSLKLNESELIELASQIGSDTAFFVRNTPQLCRGRGEKMTPISLDLNGLSIVVIKPEGVNISTREAYAGVSPHQPEQALSDLLREPIESWQGRVKNDFEAHILEAHPLLAQIKDALIDAGAIYAAMSGSGSTMYGLFRGVDTSAMKLLNKYRPQIFELG